MNYKVNPFPIVLSESVPVPRNVQLFKVGTFNHPTYGEFKITPETLATIKKNFDDKVRGIEIAIDYAHENDSIAAAWLTSVSIAGDGDSELWGEPAWTPNGRRVITDKEFRYLSPEFNLDYEDAESGKKFGPTLLGVGLTNRPFLKDMTPIVELSETTEGEQMTIQELEAKVKKLSEENQGLVDAAKKAADVSGGMSPEDMMAKIKELEAKLAAVQGEKEAAAKKAAEDKLCAEKEVEFTKLLSEGKAVAAQKDAFMKDDMKTFISLSEKVSLGGKGSAGAGNDRGTSETPAQDEVIALAEKLVAEKKARDIGIAQSMVLSENVDLRKRFEKEVEG